MRLTLMLLVAAGALGLSGCADPYYGYGPKQTVGGVGGAVAGGLIGSQVGGGSGQLVATGVGAVLGGILGSEAGRSLDNSDRAALSQQTHYALQGQPGQTAWRNPDSGRGGYVRTQPMYRNPSYGNCREFEQTVSIGGRLETARGTACQQPDGTWQVVQ